MHEDDEDYEPTPSDVRALMAQACDLHRLTRRAASALSRSPEHHVLSHQLDEVIDHLQRAAWLLDDTAGTLARARLARSANRCGIPWGVCPEHGGTLMVSSGQTLCMHPRCSRVWAYDRMASVCGDPVTHRVADARGNCFLACGGHALEAERRLSGGSVTQLSNGR